MSSRIRILPRWSGSKPGTQPLPRCHPWYSHALPGSEEGRPWLPAALAPPPDVGCFLPAGFLAAGLPMDHRCPYFVAEGIQKYQELYWGAYWTPSPPTRQARKKRLRELRVHRCRVRAAAQTTLSGESGQHRGTWA